MADYSKILASVLYSENSDYSDPEFDPALPAYTMSTATQVIRQRISAATGGTTVTISDLSRWLALVIKNTDSSNYVEAVFTYTNGSSSDTINKVPIPPGGMLVVTGPTTGTPRLKDASNLVLTANTAACLCDVIIIGN